MSTQPAALERVILIRKSNRLAVIEMHLTLCTSLRALHSMHFTLCTSLYALDSLHFTLCTSLYALDSVYFTLCTSLCALHSMHFSLCCWVRGLRTEEPFAMLSGIKHQQQNCRGGNRPSFGRPHTDFHTSTRNKVLLKPLLFVLPASCRRAPKVTNGQDPL